MKDLEEIKYLTGDAPRTGTTEDINAALEENLESIFDKFDSKVDDRIKKAVNQAAETALERASAATNPQMTKQINDLKCEVGALRSQLTELIKALKDATCGHAGSRGGGGSTTTNRSSDGASSVSDADAALQIGKKVNMLAWKAGMKFNSHWNGQQRTNYNRLLKHHDLNEHKRQQKAFFHKKMEDARIWGLGPPTTSRVSTPAYCMMHISVQFSGGRSFVGFRIRYYVSKLFLPIGENTKEFVKNVPRV